MKMNSFPRWPALAFGLPVSAVLAGGISFYSNERQHASHDADWVSMKANTSVSPAGGRV